MGTKKQAEAPKTGQNQPEAAAPSNAAPSPQNKKTGRPPCYEAKVRPYLAQIAQQKINGAQDAQIAQMLGISLRSLYSYKKQYPELREALTQSAAGADLMVENALFRLATGYTRRQKKQTVKYDNVIEYEEEVFYPPNITAIAFYLTNRMGLKYRKNQPLPQAEEHNQELRLSEVGR